LAGVVECEVYETTVLLPFERILREKREGKEKRELIYREGRKDVEYGHVTCHMHMTTCKAN
jgi:hypothetical protein